MIIEAMRKQCPVCGFPWVTSFVLRWRDNGTITMFMRNDFRAVVMRQGQVQALMQHIEDRLGVSIEHMGFEAQRNAARMTFDNTFDGTPGVRLMLKMGHFKRVAVEYFNLIGATCGQCHSDTLEYVPGRRGVARLKNPFYMPLMAAYVVGAFESMEGVPFKSEWEETGVDTYTITAEAAGEKPEVSDRLNVGVAPLLPGHNSHESCPKCRAPRALSFLHWNLDEGIITDTRTGARVLIFDGHGINALYRELVAELGEEVYQLLVDAQRDWTVEHIGLLGITPSSGALSRGELEEAYREYLSMMPLEGLGNPVALEIKDSSVEVVIENPYNAFVLAGTLQGLYEAFEKTPGKVEWTESRPGAVRFKVEP